MKWFSRTPKADQRSDSFGFNGVQYAIQQTLQSNGPTERPSAYGDLAWTYRTNPVVFACLDLRAKLFSEARFQFRRLQNGRPGEFFGSPELLPIEIPWRNGDTGALLARAIQDADLSGNAYFVRRGASLYRLRPDWVTIAISSPSGDVNAYDAEIGGYLYSPNGADSEAIGFLPEEICHWKPCLDPAFRHRGMSPLIPAMADIYSDGSMTDFKARFLENGAAPSLVMNMAAGQNPEEFALAVSRFRAAHGAVEDKGKPLFLDHDTTVKVVGSNLEQIDFKQVQSGGETRIAAALGVPPVLAGLSEGLDASSYAHYSAARRRLFDATIAPLLRSFAAALETVINVPPGAFLAYDARDIPWLQEDVKDEADIRAVDAGAIKSLIDAGMAPDSVISAVTTGDLTRLKHTGLTSVQLLPPGSPNGNGNGAQQNGSSLIGKQ